VAHDTGLSESTRCAPSGDTTSFETKTAAEAGVAGGAAAARTAAHLEDSARRWTGFYRTLREEFDAQSIVPCQ